MIFDRRAENVPDFHFRNMVTLVLGAVSEEVLLFAKAAKFVVLQERVGFLRFLVIS